MRNTYIVRVGLGLAVLVAAVVTLQGSSGEPPVGRPHRDGGASAPTQSGPIALTSDGRFAWVANPDANTVTLLEVGGDSNRKLDEIRVGREPRNVAISPDDKWVYVSNAASGTVSVIRANQGNPHVVQTVAVGTEPDGMAFTPNGSRLYVADARSNDVVVMSPNGHRVVGRIGDVGPEPRGIAITNDGDGDDDDEKVYVTNFLSVDRPGTIIGDDDYKEGRVAVISTADDQVIGHVTLAPMKDTGFKSNGSAIHRVPATDPPTFAFVTGAFPNMLNSIAIKGARAYLPNTAASPDGPVRFNVNVQAFLSVIDTRSDAEGQANGASQTINMNRGINFEPPGPPRLFLGVPWAIAFEHDGPVGWVVAAASNVAVKVVLNADGTPTINAPTGPGQPSGIVRIPTGQNPRGIVINSSDTRAYVANEVSRDVTVIDLVHERVLDTVSTSDLPPPGSPEASLVVGKALFNTSTGVNLPSLGVTVPLRMSSEGWSGCFSCHPNGLTDGVVWIFATGPRRTLPLNGSFNPRDPHDIKILNYSGVNDEIQDFEGNIRNVSGGLGLITLADGVTPDPVLNSFNPPNTGRSALLDALTLFVARGIRTPNSPVGDGDVGAGRALFAQANCAACHGGGGWATSRRDYTPPPNPADIANGQLKRFLRQAGTFNPAAVNEVRANGAPALGADGFIPPSLLGAHGLGPFLHNGSALTVADVLENVIHRSAGTGGVDVLTNAADRATLARFVESIDASTEPFAPAALLSAHLRTEAIAAMPGPDAAAGRTVLELAGGNPGRGPVMLRYALSRSGDATLEVFDLEGRTVAVLDRGFRGAGSHLATWNGRDARGALVPAGVYMARLLTADEVKLTKLVRAR